MGPALLLGALFLLSSGSSSGSARAAPPPPRAPPPSSKGPNWEETGKTVGSIIKGAKSVIDAIGEW